MKRISELEFHKDIEYIVYFGGGIGPTAWDKEEIIKAKSIREALDKADTLLHDTPDCMISGIEQFNA